MMDNEKRASDWPIKPGLVVVHTSDGDGDGMSPDVGIEIGLTDKASLYIGEVSSQTLAEHGVKVPFAGWWVCLHTATELQPLALTCQGADGGEAETLLAAIGAAISKAEDRGKTEAFDPLTALDAFNEDFFYNPATDEDHPADTPVSDIMPGVTVGMMRRYISDTLARLTNPAHRRYVGARGGETPAPVQHTDDDTPARILQDLCALLARPEIDRVPECKSMAMRAGVMVKRGL